MFLKILQLLLIPKPHSMKTFKSLLCIYISAFLFSCNKIENQPPINLNENSKTATATLPAANFASYFSAPFVLYNGDSIERITVLGA